MNVYKINHFIIVIAEILPVPSVAKVKQRSEFPL